jgi:glycosyltransferase involved in cell wall biosynthesis
VDIALLAPSPVPLTIGGAENLWWGLLRHLNRHTRHNADLIKLPTPERNFWEIVDSYRRWADVDASGYDLVISGKYPGWMVAHDRHVCYLLHPLRGLYDTYPAGLPTRCDSSHPEVKRLVELLDQRHTDREVLVECFGRLDAVRKRGDVPSDLFALPGPLIRQVVHFLDQIGRGPGKILRSAAISATVAQRPGYFAEGDHPAVAHPPTALESLHEGRRRYLFTASRLDGPKRIDLLIRAMSHVRANIELRIAGAGPQEPYLRDLASGDPRIKLLGPLTEAELVEAYADARVVLFVPDREDYGFITLEAMLSGKPVITTTDSGGPTELIRHRVNGLVTRPDPVALGRAITVLTRLPWLGWWMGRKGREGALEIRWDRVVSKLLDGIDV